MKKVAILHYSAPPVVGGVESVILSHTRLFVDAGFPVTVIAGRGSQDALPAPNEFIMLPELDSQHPGTLQISQGLEAGNVPHGFEEMVTRLVEILTPVLRSFDILIVHNIFTKHFHLPLTAALFRMLDQGAIGHCLAWCHDLTWTSPRSRARVFPGYPWDLLRTQRTDITYVSVSKERQQELADLFGCPPTQIHVVYNGVDPAELLALSDFGLELIERLDLWDSDLNLLMPVRVTQAKNIELALRVTAVLKARGIKVKLVVTGPPDPHDRANMEYFQSLLALRKQLGVMQEARFAYESGPKSTEPFIIGRPVVADLLRASDALFMPSHREGFGMPILEAGLAGLPVFCADSVPAANEIGEADVVKFSADASPDQVADLMLERLEHDPVFRLRRRTRRGFTWQHIFQHQILPLMDRGAV